MIIKLMWKLLILSQTTLALPPPASNGQLCKINATVKKISVEDATDEALRPLKIEVVDILIKKIEVYKKLDLGHFDCQSLQLGKIDTFRNCDNFNFKTNQNIEAVIGTSKGGGRYCIEQIKLLK